MDSEFVLMKN